ncbi:MAG: hypothetical protein ACPHK8_02215 [Thermoplasmatota archaeon]
MKRILLAVAVALLFVPIGAAQEVNPTQGIDTSLYFHIFDPFAKFVINTQPFNASFFDVGGVVFGANPYLEWDYNTIYGYSTAGPVEYEFNEKGKPRFHPERGIAADVVIDENKQPEVVLYVNPRGVEGGYETPPAHIPTTFRAQVRTGDDPGSNFNDGTLIMDGTYTAYLMGTRQCPAHAINVATAGLVYFTSCFTGHVDPVYGHYLGQSGPGIGNESLPTEHPVDGTDIRWTNEDQVIEIRIPLNIASNRIPKEDAYNIRIDWYEEVGPFGPDEFQSSSIHLVSSQEYLPRMELSVFDPVYVEFLHPQVAGGTLLVHAGVNSPWGTYDLDVKNIKMTIDGPTIPGEIEKVEATNAHVHGLHDEAAQITYLWKFRDENAANGEYTITLEVPNLQGTAKVVTEAKFTIDGKKLYTVDEQGKEEVQEIKDPVKESPGVSILALMAALGAALVTLRRRP